MDVASIDVTRLIIALVCGLIVLMFMIMRTKIHVTLALILSAAFMGIIGGMKLSSIPTIITNGFGSTLGSIGLVIAFGVMMGEVMEKSNAAKVMARTFINALKGKHEELAIAFTGFLVSIPIFSDSAFVILSPLIKSISQHKKKSITAIGMALGMSLCITHASVPPTPGPLAVVAQFGEHLDLGTFILFSIVMGLPIMFVALLCGKYFGNKFYKIVDEDGLVREVTPEEAKVYAVESAKRTIVELDPNEHYPSALISFAPIFVPVILILLSSVVNMLYPESVSMAADIVKFIGNPVIAVGIGLLVAIYGLTGTQRREDVIACMEKGIDSCGIIILITGAGGAFGNVIRSSGVGDAIAAQLIEANFPILLLPFIMAGILKLVLGSGTVAMTTTATILAPILTVMPDVNVMYCAYAACMGSQMFSLHNDSYFWVVTRTLGLNKINEQVGGWCATVFISSWASFGLLLIVNSVF